MRNRTQMILSLLTVSILWSGMVSAHGDYDRGQRIAIVAPHNNAVVSSPVTVKFQAHGVKIAPAGVDKHNAGHFHLMVDVDANPTLDEPMQESDQHIRISSGEMEITLELSLGKHTLQAVVADEEHTHFENLVSPKVTLFVER